MKSTIWLIDRLKKAYKKLVLPSKADYIFHFLFAFQVSYTLQIIIFVIEQIFNIFEIVDNQGIVLFYLGLFISVILVTFFLYRLFHWLDDVDETHNQVALGLGVIFSVLLFGSIQNFDISLNFLWVDIGIILASILLNTLIFMKFTKRLLIIIKEFFEK